MTVFRIPLNLLVITGTKVGHALPPVPLPRGLMLWLCVLFRTDGGTCGAVNCIQSHSIMVWDQLLAAGFPRRDCDGQQEGQGKQRRLIRGAVLLPLLPLVLHVPWAYSTYVYGVCLGIHGSRKGKQGPGGYLNRQMAF